MSPSHRTRLLAAGVLLLICAVIAPKFFRTTDAQSTPGRQPGKTSRSTNTLKQDELPSRDPQAADLAADRWHQELLAKHPYFEINYKDVPDEENGILQLIRFVESLGSPPTLPESESLLPILESKAPWDANLVAKWFEAHPDTLERLLEISELENQSTKGVPIPTQFSIIPAANHLGLLLRSHGRLAIEQGDIDTARRSYSAAINLAAHLDRTEAPSLLHAIVASGMRNGADASFREHILPRISESPDQLRTWRDSLSREATTPSYLSRVAVGEWHMVARNVIIPELLGRSAGNGINRVPDPDAFLDTYSNRMENLSRTARTWQSHADASPPSPPSVSHLSETSQEMLGESLDLNSLITGFQADHTRTIQHQAALAIMLGEEPPVEPHTGQPFRWNPGTRVLSPPKELETADFQVEAITLP